MLSSWVNYKAGNHDFLSIKVTCSSEPKSWERLIKKWNKTETLQCSILKSQREEVFFIPLESTDSQEFINQRWTTNELKICWVS